MKISEEGLSELIKSFESIRLTPYLCPKGKLTIGYGHVILPNENFTEITQKEAVDLLRKDVSIAEECVNSFIKAPLMQYQFDALVSLCFNIGCNAFKKSTLARKLNNYLK